MLYVGGARPSPTFWRMSHLELAQCWRPRRSYLQQVGLWTVNAVKYLVLFLVLDWSYPEGNFAHP